MDSELADICRGLRLMVFDFDGVFTDNTVFVFEDGREAVQCSRVEGFGLRALEQNGVELMVLSTEVNPVVAHRAKKLKLACEHGCEDKLTRLKEIAAEKGLDASQIAYMGNDINDKACLEWVGLPVLVADHEPGVAGLGRLVSQRKGGKGAVREICDLITAILEGRQ